ncbi:MAG: DUF2508 family protein [Thermoanaerobacteraceae bacterium]|nr:DUF2508 family protein [Thermoanaerobacteraceae bacterium]
MKDLRFFLHSWYRRVKSRYGPFFIRQVPSAVDIIDQARQDWQEANREFDLVDSELTDYIIFKINTAERRLVALLQWARRQGITAWPAGSLTPEVREQSNHPGPAPEAS